MTPATTPAPGLSAAFSPAAAALIFAAAGAVGAADALPGAGAAEALRARYASLEGELRSSPFDRPLALASAEGPDRVSGEIHALLGHPFATAGAALAGPSPWCDILILHLNTKYCRPSSEGGRTVLHVIVGGKHDQSIDEAYRLDFDYRVVASTANYVHVNLASEAGPLGTSDYRIDVEAVPVTRDRTFIRLAYSYAYGRMAGAAMRVYLGTVGRNKVGFTVVGRQSGGGPAHIGGMRGLVERNTMRYYLAIEAFLGALSAPAHSRLEKSLRDWFEAAERYPRQLHEMDRREYMDMKRREYSRQQVEVIADGQP